ncbi:phosphoribosylformylglycinamidine synthase subunit PurQ [Desulfolutivibrio sulfoxidireducens]|uniref:phosphoribosylformylglycinamidine synthase subunit PurQ n=1 Tax=Desulfolutivibrio sulfoxidireducens TaxID=2773299 RepID=UPI00159D8F2C|nr:phosphoribosylformylglycinamidine synthase subunit PurQ [Desulfolutivibrio sulfoxidireducens]QLA16237.1 phosphoribosylformylglycinamidine synthase subunit PurQ [Desulfolutivibrio sulfoxidireducens]QLA21621.1 phosphoribosylformylglycinamidine synthase subunit PurQ [Desulfolutivibrio sulfoxidireducens]
MPRVKTIVVTGFGTNCEVESAHAATVAGSEVTDIAFFSDITAGRTRLPDYNFLIFPGGFLDGDDLGAAQAAALRWTHAKTVSGEPVIDQLLTFLANGGIILGICNGFQLLVKIGLLPGRGGNALVRELSLSNNDSARFEDRWVTLMANPDCRCVFTRGIARIDLPVRHGEGKLVPRDEAVLAALWSENLVALQYADPATGRPTEAYPQNPNGSPMGIAGLTDPTGRILGLMPHPEAFNHPTNHPGWTRGEKSILGTALLENGVRYLKSST